MSLTLKGSAHAAAERLEDAVDIARRKAEDLSEAVEDLTTSTLRMARKHPGRTIAISLAAGFLLGAVVAWSRRD